MKSSLWIFIFFLFYKLNCIAQYRAEGCVIYEEPKRKLVYESIRTFSQKTILEDSLIIAHYYKKEGDSVSVTREGKKLSTFIIKNNWISGDTYQEYDSSGTLRLLDTFNTSAQGAQKHYYGYYSARNIRLSKAFYPGGSLRSVLYYSSSGSDSLYREWSSDGALKFIKRFKNDSDLSFDHYPIAGKKPIETLEYYPNGVLAKKEKTAKNYSAEYWKTGALKRVSSDTSIRSCTVTCVKDYYPNKNIRSIHYFQNGEPCYIWSAYSEAGILQNSIKKPAIRTTIGPSLEAPAQIYTFVEQMAEYPGGMLAFQKYTEEKLLGMSYTYSDLLSGKYCLVFEVTPDGKTTFIDIKGFQPQQLKSQFRSFIESMPLWHPAKLNGRSISESFEIVLKTI